MSAEIQTPKKQLSQSPKKLKQSNLTPKTPQTQTPLRRSARIAFDIKTPQNDESAPPRSTKSRRRVNFGEPGSGTRRGKGQNDEFATGKSRNSRRSWGVGETGSVTGRGRSEKVEKSGGFDGKGKELKEGNEVEVSTPARYESAKKRKRDEEKGVFTRSTRLKGAELGNKRSKKKVYYKRIKYDEGEFEVGDDVYVKRKEDVGSDGGEEDPEVEECRVCFESGEEVMIECDDCLGGFHLGCLKPPLGEVPEGDWICGFCEARTAGKKVEMPVPPEGKKKIRTLREKLLSSDLWAACIERLWFLDSLFMN